MSACQRPGCSGSYQPDGYCDECGRKAPAAAAPAGSGRPAAGRGPVSALTPVSRPNPSSGLIAPSGAGLSGGSGSSTGRGSRTAGRGRLGANLVAVAPVPLLDPATAVRKNPAVPESQRFCGQCGEPVGRGRDGVPGRTEGFCSRDRTRYSFTPRLQPGDLIDNRYEILGALAHGGLGWIYLARDGNISDADSDRWVVLKGLINTGDPDAMAAAVTERRFLVSVDHPNIVKIHDFAQHPDPITGERVGYIVMEYVGGRSLKDLALATLGPDGRRAPLPLPVVLAYGIEILPALGYLHERGLLFCDFKPDNVIHAEEQLKLIDLGAVRRIDDHESALYGTPGYQAPELATDGPSISSDLYTVGRTLAVLSFEFGGFSTRYADRLPPPEEVPLLAREESYHRLLRRATHLDATRRFTSTGEFTEQLTGVLREVLSATDGVPRPAPSGVFTPERRAFGTVTGVDGLTDAPATAAAGVAIPAGALGLAGAIGMAGGSGSVGGAPAGSRTAATAPAGGSGLVGATVAAALPLPLVDPADPGAGYLATLGSTDPATTVAALAAVPVRSLEVILRMVRARLEAGEPAAAQAELDSLTGGESAGLVTAGDWRLDWYTGLVALAGGDADRARLAFDAVYDALPGELAPQLAVAVTAELAGDRDTAIRRYERVWRVDHGYVSAAFGLARTLIAAGDRVGAVSIYDEVPDSSSQYVAAQIAAVRARLDQAPGELSEADLVDASGRLDALALDGQRQATLAIEVLRTALAWVAIAPSGRPTAGPGSTGAPAVTGAPASGAPAQRVAAAGRVLGHLLSEREVRFGLERAYRMLASHQRDPRARHALVDQANSVRPRTVV